MWRFPGQRLNQRQSCQPPTATASGIEPMSSWMVVRFISTEPQQELPLAAFYEHLRSPQHRGHLLGFPLPDRWKRPLESFPLYCSIRAMPTFPFVNLLFIHNIPRIQVEELPLCPFVQMWIVVNCVILKQEMLYIVLKTIQWYKSKIKSLLLFMCYPCGAPKENILLHHLKQKFSLCLLIRIHNHGILRLILF